MSIKQMSFKDTLNYYCSLVDKTERVIEQLKKECLKQTETSSRRIYYIPLGHDYYKLDSNQRGAVQKYFESEGLKVVIGLSNTTGLSWYDENNK